MGYNTDDDPQCFTGYLKEFKLLNKYHGFAQLRSEKLRMMRYYSYDDDFLVAYWKLAENYVGTEKVYTISDYSIHGNTLTYSTISDEKYPSFVYDASIQLNLCLFHDVAICRTLDYWLSHPTVT